MSDRPGEETAREAKLRERREERIKAAFERYDSTGAGRTSHVTLLASPDLIADASETSVLSEVRLKYDSQMEPHGYSLSNLLLWRVDDRPAPTAVLVFPPDVFLRHLSYRTLDAVAQSAIACLPSAAFIFAIPAIDRLICRSNRTYVREGEPNRVITPSALQDAYTHLDIEYGIRVHIAASHAELSHTVKDWTDAVTLLPTYTQDSFLDATLAYRRNRRGGISSAVIASEPVGDLSSEEDETELGQPTGVQIRVEGPRDVSYWYMSILRMIPGVSVPKAKAIRHEYPSYEILMDAYAKCRNHSERESMLADIRYADRRRRIGPHVSKTISILLHSEDGSQLVPS